MSPEGVAGLAQRFPRAFVTGGSGFIGSHVVARLLEEGVAVRALVMPGDPAPLLDGLDVERVVGDVTDRRALAAAMAGCDVVFNLAAIYALWLPNPAKMFEVNVGGALAVTGAARDAGVPRVVHTSSIAAVGYLPGREISDETVAFNDWAVADGYVLSKYISEREALLAAGPDLDVVCVNPAFPFGARDIGPTPTGKLIRDTIRGEFPVVVEGGLNAVDVRDVAEGHLLGALHGVSGERYLLGGDNLTYRELTEIVARLSGRRAPRFRVPVRLLEAAGAVAELVADKITHKRPRLTARSVAYAAGRYLWFSTAKAQRDLGYRPRPVEEALAHAIGWFSSQSG